MNRTHRPPRDLSDLPTPYFVVPAVLWSVVVAAALLGPPSDDISGSPSAKAEARAVAATVEGA